MIVYVYDDNGFWTQISALIYLAVWPYASYLTSLNFNFSASKMGMVIIASKNCFEDEMNEYGRSAQHITDTHGMSGHLTTFALKNITRYIPK